MKKQNKQNGITLIALVITIIILLILAGISISALTNQGLFTQAQNAKNLTEEKTAEESATLSEYEQWLANYMGGGTSSGGETLASKVRPGEYVTYTPDTASTGAILTELGTYSGSTENTTDALSQENLKWRVLDVVDGKVRLISEVPTTSTVTLEGAKGYNNAVYLLDKTCSTLYSKTGYSEKVQNLKIEDIQKYLTYDYTQYENEYVDTGKYGGTCEFTEEGYRYYPNLFAKEKTGWVNGTQGTELNLSEQITPINEESTQAGTSIKVTQTYWEKEMSETDFNNSIYYNLFINNGTYCMSSRCVDADTDDAYFLLSCVVDYEDEEYPEDSMHGIYADDLYSASDYIGSGEYNLRPVITLNANVLVTSGEGTSATPYEIGL